MSSRFHGLHVNNEQCMVVAEDIWHVVSNSVKNIWIFTIVFEAERDFLTTNAKLTIKNKKNPKKKYNSAHIKS